MTHTNGQGHTSGPWEAPGKDGDSFVICTHRSKGNRRTVAHAYTEDDARLIAAAPDLLEALQFVATDPCFSTLGSVTHDVVRAALSRVSGGER